MSSEESTAPAGRDGSDAPPDDRADADTSPEVTDGAEPTKAKKAKKVKEPKAPKAAREPKPPKEPKAKKEKAPKEPKAAKEPKPPKEPKAKKEKAPKEPKPAKVKTPRRARKGGDPVDEVADDELEVGWSTGDGATDDGVTFAAAAADGAAVDGGDGTEPEAGETGEAGSRTKRRTLVGAAAIGPLLLLGALFLPTDRGRHGATAMAAPTTVPADDGAVDDPPTSEPEDATPRFLVTVEQDLPATTTTLSPTTTAAGHGEAGHTAASATGHEIAGHEATEGATASTTKRSSTRTTAPPPFVVTQYDREDTQLAVFVLLDGRKIELAVPVRYFRLASISDPAQQTFDKEVAGHLLVVDRDGRYWGADLQAVPALLYQLPSSKPLTAPTVAPVDGTPVGTTTTTIHEGGHPATGTTVHESTVHEDADVALTTPGSAEPAADHATDHATTTTGTHAAAADAEGPDSAEGTEGDEAAETATDEAVEQVTTTTRVRAPFPLVVNGPVSDEDERVVRLLAALPGVTSVLDLGRGAVLVEGDVDLETILNVPGVLAAQPSGN